jgi:hypothetical protein
MGVIAGVALAALFAAEAAPTKNVNSQAILFSYLNDNPVRITPIRSATRWKVLMGVDSYDNR